MDVALDASNDFGGTVTMDVSGSATLNDINDIDLGDSTVVEALDVTAATDITISGDVGADSADLKATAGSITDSTGTLTVTTTTNLVAGVDVALDASNDFGGTVTMDVSGSATLNDINDIDLGDSTVVRALDVTAATDITISGDVSADSADLKATAGSITDSTGTLTVTTTTNLVAGVDVALDASNDFGGTVTMDVSGSATLNDINDIELGDSTVVGALDVTAATDITISGDVSTSSATSRPPPAASPTARGP